MQKSDVHVSATVGGAQSSPSGAISLMAYGGIFQDNYVKAVVEPFQKAFPNVRVNYVATVTSAQMLGAIRAQKADPQIDVVIIDVTTATIGNAEGLFSKLTPQEVPSLDDLYPEARAVGGPFGPAVLYDHLVLVYDRQNLNPPLARLADLWRPDLKGQLAVSAPPNIQGLALTAMVTKMEGGNHTQSIDPGIKKLRELAPSVQTWEPNPDGYTLILNGVVRVATGWNARAQLYSDETNGPPRRRAAAGGLGLPGEHHQCAGGRQEPRRRACVHQLCALARGAEVVQRTDVLRPGQRQGRRCAGCAGANRRLAGEPRAHDPGRLGRDRQGPRPMEQPLAPRDHRGTLTVSRRGAGTS